MPPKKKMKRREPKQPKKTKSKSEKKKNVKVKDAISQFLVTCPKCKTVSDIQKTKGKMYCEKCELEFVPKIIEYFEVHEDDTIHRPQCINSETNKMTMDDGRTVTPIYIHEVEPNKLPNTLRTWHGQTFKRNQIVIPTHRGKDKLLGRNHPIHWRNYRGLFTVRGLNDEERG